MNKIRLNKYQSNSLKKLYEEIRNGISFICFKKILIHILEEPLPYHDGKQLIEILCPNKKSLLENGDEVSQEDYVRIMNTNYDKTLVPQSEKGDEEYSIFNACDFILKELPELKDKNLSENDIEILASLEKI